MGQTLKGVHGGDILSCLEKYGDKSFIDFSASINPLGQPESVKLAISSCADACAHYPDPLCRRLISSISNYENIPESYIVCGNGAADIIYRISACLKPKTALLTAPSFLEYERALKFCGCGVDFYMLDERRNFEPDEDILGKIPSHDIMFLCNPNNPTGGVLSRNLLSKIVKVCGEHNVALVVDECFMDFLENSLEKTIKPFLQNNGNIILLKAFTKIFAIPGIRLGYALTSNARIHGLLERGAAPWSVSVPAELCGAAASNERDFVKKTVEAVSVLRKDLEAGLLGLGLKVYPGLANYILFKSHDDSLKDKLCELGIIIRDCSGFRGLEPGFYRVAVKTAEENLALLNALKHVLNTNPH